MSDLTPEEREAARQEHINELGLIADGFYDELIAMEREDAIQAIRELVQLAFHDGRLYTRREAT